MDISTLKAFLAVAETQSFSKAAKQLFLTQPAVSKRVATLESELDAKLFDRIGRNINLTEAGHTLLPRAHKILLDVEDSVRTLTNLSGEIKGILRFATSHHIGLHRLPPTLQQFTKSHPNVQLDIAFMDSETACRAVERGDMELGVVTLPLERSAQLKTITIWPDPLTAVIGHGHVLARKNRITLNDLASHPAILPAMNTYTRQIAEEAFNKLGLNLDVSLSTNYLETIKMLVSVGIGWSVLPETMLDKKVRKLPIKSLRLQRKLGVVFHRERTLSNAARRLISLLEQ
jgi:DNA-binding transcriptional LysR family regulator